MTRSGDRTVTPTPTVDLIALQNAIWHNKQVKGFNTVSVPIEFCHLQAEASELFDAWRRTPDAVGEELADVGIFTLSLTRMLRVDVAALQPLTWTSGRVHGYSWADAPEAVCALQAAIGRLFDVWQLRNRPAFPEKLTVIAVSIVIAARTLDVDLLTEIERKVAINRGRTYQLVDGVPTRAEVRRMQIANDDQGGV
jgi:hypothetical protein